MLGQELREKLLQHFIPALTFLVSQGFLLLSLRLQMRTSEEGGRGGGREHFTSFCLLPFVDDDKTEREDGKGEEEAHASGKLT